MRRWRSAIWAVLALLLSLCLRGQAQAQFVPPIHIGAPPSIDGAKIAEPLSHFCRWLNAVAVKPAAELPLRHKTIVVDPGHGGSDPGACRLGVRECNITLAVAKQLKKQLERLGAKVVLTRSDNSDVELPDRVAITEAARADLFISIHVNASTRDDKRGLQTYYRMDCSRMYAHTLHAVTVSRLGVEDGHVHTAHFWVINYPTIPSVLVEVGYISNRPDRRNLVCGIYQQKLAKALAAGIVTYFRKKRARKG